jgi:hypothetical protein
MAKHNPGNLPTPPQPGSDTRQQPGEPGEPPREEQHGGRQDREARARQEARRQNDAGEER